ncbi:hypothetical protein [Citricoccus sp. SGAir0253]|nr:hypothetical protein [Citricoccus sp. SGAir0253]
MARGSEGVAWICTCIRDDHDPRHVAVPDEECPRHGAWDGHYAFPQAS